jgi:hypothetical protein
MARESIEPQVRVGRDGKVYPATRKDAAHRVPTPLVVGKGQDVPKPVEPVAAVVESAPPVVGQSRVNGVLGADPPDIAALRAAGKIPPNTIVEITETEGGHTFEDIKADVEARKAQEDEIGDADWLAAMPLSGQLKDVPLKTFQSEALAYRHCVKYARNFGKMVAQEFNSPRQECGGGRRRQGPLQFRFTMAARVSPPDKWVRCAQPCNGGCGGSGFIEVGVRRECGQCRGCGYRITF